MPRRQSNRQPDRSNGADHLPEQNQAEAAPAGLDLPRASTDDAVLDEIAAQLRPDQIVLQPFYHDLRNEIVDPKRVRVESAYFWEKWVPRLGPVLSMLIMKLRQHCYYNKQTKERRDWCFPTQETLAKETGISIDTVQRALDPRKNPLVPLFVTKQYRSRYDPVRGCTVRTSCLYLVAMDDPLVPEDETLLLEMAAERLQPAAEQSATQTKQTARSNTNSAAVTAKDGMADPVESNGAKKSSKPRTARKSAPEPASAKPHFAALPDQSNVKPQNAVLQTKITVKPHPAALHSDSVIPQDAALHATANCGEEELLQEIHDTTTTTTGHAGSGRKAHLPDKQPDRSHSVGRARTARDASEINGEASGSPADEQVAELFSAANRRAASRLERESLMRLAGTFGHEAVCDAIKEAVESGSAFVAPRRIERICLRWQHAKDEPPSPPLPLRQSNRRRERNSGYITNLSPQTRLPGFESAAAIDAQSEPIMQLSDEPVPTSHMAAPVDSENAGQIVALLPGSATRARQLWRLTLDELQAEVPTTQITTWLRPVETLGLDASGRLYIHCQNMYTRDWIEKHYVNKLQPLLARNGISGEISFI